MIRKEAMKIILDQIDLEPIVSANGFMSRDLFELKEKISNFYMIGSMGLASSIGLGIALKNPRKKIMINNKLNFNSNHNQKYLDDSIQQANNNIGTHSNKEIIPVSENSIKNSINSQSMKNNLVVHKPNKYSGPIAIELMSDKEPLFLLNEVLKAKTSIKVLTKLKEHFGFFCQKNQSKFYLIFPDFIEFKMKTLY